MEVSETQATGMETSLKSSTPVANTTEKANFVRNRGHPSSSAPPQQQRPRQNTRTANKCGNCGYFLPHKGQCPAKGQNCNSCGKMNHFARVCRSTRSSQSRPQQRQSQSNLNTRGKRVNQVHTSPAPPSSSQQCYNNSDDEFLFTLQNQLPPTKMPIVKVKIFNKFVPMVLDTGASTDIIDQETFAFLTRNNPVSLQKSSTRRFALLSPIIKIGGRN
eukprot:gene17916-19693_t